MAGRKYEFEIEGRKVTVEADAEGPCRYMVGLFEPGLGRTRIGYLTGRGRNWVVEFFGHRDGKPFASAKAACRFLGEWALTQPGLAARESSKAATGGK